MGRPSQATFASVAGVVCLTASFVMLGMELRRALPDEVRLPAAPMRWLLVTVALLYLALAWRLSQGRGSGAAARALAAMVLAHAGLGIGLGASYAVVRGASGGTLQVVGEGLYGFPPGVVLQVALALCVALLFQGGEAEGWLTQPPAEWITEAEPTAVGISAEAGEEALDLRARPGETIKESFDALLRAGARRAQAEGAMLTTQDGLVLASSLRQDFPAERVAALLPEVVRHARQLAATPPDGSVAVSVAVGSDELVAVSGRELSLCTLLAEGQARRGAALAAPVLEHAERLYRERSAPAGLRETAGANPNPGAAR